MSDDFLTNLQSDVYGLLMATPSLALARKIQDDKGDLEATVENELATSNDESGKCGLAIIVLAAEAESGGKDLPGPPLKVRINVQCIELVELNRSESDGTQIRSSAAAIRVLQALHQTSLGGQVLSNSPNPIQPLPMRAGFVAHLVSLQTVLHNLQPNRTATVFPEWISNTLVLTCRTAGAVIFYTVDGSFPAAWNPSRIQYAGPIASLPAGTFVRFAGYAASMNPSDLGEILIPADPNLYA